MSRLIQFLPLFFSNIIVNCFASMNNYTQLHKGQDLPACPLLGVFVIYIVTIFYFLLNCSYLFAVHIIWCCLNKCDCGGDKPLFNLFGDILMLHMYKTFV